MTSGAASAAEPVQCARKQQLTDQLRALVDRLVELSVSEKRASCASDTARLEFIARELEKVRQREILLLKEYQQHVLTHKC